MGFNSCIRLSLLAVSIARSETSVSALPNNSVADLERTAIG